MPDVGATSHDGRSGVGLKPFGLLSSPQGMHRESGWEHQAAHLTMLCEWCKVLVSAVKLPLMVAALQPQVRPPVTLVDNPRRESYVGAPKYPSTTRG